MKGDWQNELENGFVNIKISKHSQKQRPENFFIISHLKWKIVISMRPLYILGQMIYYNTEILANKRAKSDLLRKTIRHIVSTTTILGIKYTILLKNIEARRGITFSSKDGCIDKNFDYFFHCMFL